MANLIAAVPRPHGITGAAGGHPAGTTSRGRASTLALGLGIGLNWGVAVVWYRLRSVGRQRGRAWLALALLVGLGGGIVLGALAAARRTDSAYRRFLEDANAFDVGLAGTAFAIDFEPARRLPQVADSATISYLLMEGEGGRLDGALGPLLPSEDGLYDRINRPKVLAGRRPDPSRADEVSVSRLAAERYGLEVGHALTMRAYRPDQAEALLTGDQPPPTGPRFTFRVVGIVATPTELLPTSPNPIAMHLTPAFHRAHSKEVAAVSGLVFKLRRGAADVSGFKSDVERIAGDAPVQFITAELDASQVQRTIHLQAVALRLFAALTAVAAVLILGQALARQTALESRDYPALRAVGMTRAQLWAASMAQAGAIAGVGALAAVGVAAALSPLAPIGLARDAEPRPGFAFDRLTLGLGFVAIIVLMVVVAAAPTWRAVRTLSPEQIASRVSSDSKSRLLSLLGNLGLPVGAMTGVRMAVAPGRAGGYGPLRNAALACTIFCISAVAMVAAFGASLEHLLATPRLYGWDWDVIVGNPYLSDLGEQALPVLTGSDSIAGVSSITVAETDIDGTRTTALAFEPALGTIMPPVTEGRAPRQPDEILVGTKTLRDLGSGIGRIVTVRVADRAVAVRIVGRGVLPSLIGAGDVSGLGRGVLFTAQGLRRLVPDVARNQFAVRFATGVDAGRAAQEISVLFGDPTGPEPPKSVADFGRVDALPAVLAGLLTLLAMATLAHTTLTMVRRGRRDLAILKTLGFVRGQIRSTVAAQATALMLVSVAVGVPLGLVAGRWAWRLFADSLGIVPEPVVPVAVVLAIVPAALLVANLIAAVPGHMASRVRPAIALQAE